MEKNTAGCVRTKGALPAASARQEQADEDVVLRSRIVDFDPEHGNRGRTRLDSSSICRIVGTVPAGRQRNPPLSSSPICRPRDFVSVRSRSAATGRGATITQAWLRRTRPQLSALASHFLSDSRSESAFFLAGARRTLRSLKACVTGRIINVRKIRQPNMKPCVQETP